MDLLLPVDLKAGSTQVLGVSAVMQGLCLLSFRCEQEVVGAVTRVLSATFRIGRGILVKRSFERVSGAMHSRGL